MNSVAVILVNFKSAEKTISCLRALEQGSVKPTKVYVIDNASTEASQKVFLAESFQIPVDWIWNKENVGFAAGCNKGIKAAQQDGLTGYIWLLNNDTCPDKFALQKIVEKAEETHAGITGSAIYNAAGKFAGGVGIFNSKFASVKHVSDVECENFDYVEGASFLISPGCLRKVGLLSEEYFLYFEESDYCKKAEKAGFSLAWAKESIIHHDIGSSTGSENKKGCVPFFIDCLMIRNRVHFARHSGFPTWGNLMGLMISLGLRFKRLQFNRIVTILWILLSQKNLKKFIEKHGGYYEIH